MIANNLEMAAVALKTREERLYEIQSYKEDESS